MATAMAANRSEGLTFEISDEIHVRAPMEVTFAALLEQLGPRNEVDPKHPLPMRLQPWPGGKWMRDLGENDGDFWGHVQAIKRPQLIEFWGPMILSHRATSNVQYRLSEEPGGTLIQFHHRAFGAIEDDYQEVVDRDWNFAHARMKGRAEARVADAQYSGSGEIVAECG
jgi:hypothetical protein